MFLTKIKYILPIVVSLFIFSCKNAEEKKTDALEEVSADANSDLQTIEGDFIYIADAAVLQAGNDMYSVEIDEMSQELAEKVKPAKTDNFDMVHVVVKATVSQKPEEREGWDKVITIKKIVSVSDIASPADIKIEANKN